MKLQRRIWIYSGIVIAGLIIFFAYRYIGSRVWGLTYPWNSFLFFEQDRFMDFFHINDMVAGFNPYSNGSSYPPLALMIAYVFANNIPRTGTESAFALRDSSQIGKFLLYSLYIVCLLLIFVAVWRRIGDYLRKERANNQQLSINTGKRTLWSVVSRISLYGVSAMSIALSAPMIYAFDRGNYLILSVLFLTLFCLYFDKNDYAAAVFLAVAACLKLFPIVLFFVFLSKRKWKPLALVLFTGAAATAVCAAIFNGGMLRNLWRFAQGVFRFSGGEGSNSSYYYQYSIGLRNIIGTLSVILRGYVSDRLHIAKLSLALGVLLLAVVIIMCIMDTRPWRQILYLSFFMILFPSPSYYYNLAYLTGPILLFLFKEKKEKWDGVYFAGLALLMISKSYYYFPAHFSSGDGWIGLDCILDPLIMCLLLGISIIELLKIRKETGKQMEPGEKKDLVGI